MNPYDDRGSTVWYSVKGAVQSTEQVEEQYDYAAVWVADSMKIHGDVDSQAAVSDYANAEPQCGQTIVTTGLLGLGKLMSTYRTVGSDQLILGKAPAEGSEALLTGQKQSIDPRCVQTGPTPQLPNSAFMSRVEENTSSFPQTVKKLTDCDRPKQAAKAAGSEK